MNPRVIRAIIQKDVVDLLRNRSTLLGLLSPIFFALFYLLISKVSPTSDPVPIYTFNPAGIVVTQTLGLGQDAPTRIVNAPDAASVERELAKANTEYRFGVVLPANLVTDMQAGKQPGVALYVNGKKLDDSLQRQRYQSSFYAYLASLAPQQPPFKLTYQEFGVDKEKEANSALSKLFGGPKGLAGFYAGFTLALTPILIGLQVLPITLVEEKEKKTLRMLLTSPASTLDVVIAKGLVGVGYAMLISAIVFAINWSLFDNPLLVIAFALLSTLFACGLGMMLGAIFNTAQSLNAWAGLALTVSLIPGLIGVFQPTGIVNVLVHLVPTYYLFDGTIGATAGTLNFSSGLLDLAVGAVLVVVVFTAAAFVLRRRSLYA